MSENLNEAPKDSQVTGVFIQFQDRGMVNIADLSRVEYEEFLDMMHMVRTSYLVAINRTE